MKLRKAYDSKKKLKIKSTHLFLITLINLVGIAYASIYDNWPDESICSWLEQKPDHEGYLAEDKKRSLNCFEDPNFNARSEYIEAKGDDENWAVTY